MHFTFPSRNSVGRALNTAAVVSHKDRIILEAGSARALPWTRIGDGEMFESVSLNALSTSSP